MCRQAICSTRSISRTDGSKSICRPLQLRVSDTIPEELRERAEYVFVRLHLRDDERVMRQRREWYRMYQCGELSQDGLEGKAPLIAAAIDRV